MSKIIQNLNTTVIFRNCNLFLNVIYEILKKLIDSENQYLSHATFIKKYNMCRKY